MGDRSRVICCYYKKKQNPKLERGNKAFSQVPDIERAPIFFNNAF